MEDSLNIPTNGRPHNVYENWKSTAIFCQWKMISIFWQIGNNLNIFPEERQPMFWKMADDHYYLENGRRPRSSENGNRPQYYAIGRQSQFLLNGM
jgi:hypothetical protein